MKHSVTKVDKLLEVLQNHAHDDFIADIREASITRRWPFACRPTCSR